MHFTSYGFCLAAVLTFAVTSSGCNSQNATNDQATGNVSGAPSETVDGHDHGDDQADEHQGPHGGHVLELGRNHQYHAEIVEDSEQKMVTVYILGQDMTERPVDAAQLTISLMVEGTPTTYALPAANTSDGTASRFDTADSALFESLHALESSGRLQITIDSTPYTANVEHHDHDDGDDHVH